VVTQTFTVSQPAPVDDCGSSISAYCSWAALDTPINGTIETSGDKDWFRIVPTFTGTWTFTASKPATNPLADSYGTLYASDGSTVVAYDDDNAGNLQFKITATLTAGQVYFLEIRGYNTTYTGAYTVTAATTDDCGSSISAYCTWSNLATPINGTIEISGDKDWFMFTPTFTGTWTFTASKPATNPLNDSYGTIYKSDGTTVVAYDDDSAGSYQFRVTASLTAGQSYFLEVKGWSTNTGAYTVTAATTDDCGSSTSAYCTWSNLATPINGAVEISGDKDWYKITPTTTGTWVFTASKPATNPLADSYGTLYASDGTTVVAYDDDSAGNLQFKITASLTAGQTYFLEVKGWSTYTGSYTVTATAPAQTQTLTVSPNGGSFVYPVAWGGSLNLTITSNTTWQVTGPSWVTIRVASTNSATGGSGNDVVYVEAQGNSDSTARTGTVTVTTTGVTPALSSSVAVSQPASPPDDCGSSEAVHCTINLSATAAVSVTKKIDFVDDEDWFSLVVPTTRQYTISSSGLPAGAVLDTMMAVPYLPNCLLGLGGPSGTAANGNITYTTTLTAGQTYYFVVDNYYPPSTLTTFNYTLTVTPS